MIVTLLVVAALALLALWLALGAGTVKAAGASSGRRARILLVLLAGALGAQLLLGSDAQAQVPGVDDCKEAPNPERPGAGMVGALDPTPPGSGAPDSVYHEVGYAGLVWHTYDLGCGPSGIRNPDAVIDTWAGNQLFNVAKAVVAASNGLHYSLADQGLLAPLDDLIVTGTVGLYDTVYAPWLGLVALLLAIVLFRYIWRGELATVSKRALWALVGIWFAAATYLTPLLYTHVLDEVLVDGSNQIRTGFLSEVGVEERDALPTLLHEQIVYRNWLRGEFGSPDGPQAEQLGRDLVRAQAYTKEEIAQGADDPASGVAERKKREYEGIAARTGSAYGYFQGVDGSRIGIGALASLQSAMFALFQLLAQAALLLAQIILRVVILLGPVIGLIAIIYHELLRGVGRAVGAALLNVIVLSALAALHTLVMVWVFNPVHGLSVMAQMLLGGLITLVMLLVARPVRRMWQMVELSVGAVGGAMPAAPPGVLARLRRRREGVEPSPSERFWEQARTGGADTDGGHGGRVRPEATVPVVTVAAERMDRASGAGPTYPVVGAVGAGPDRPGSHPAALPPAGRGDGVPAGGRPAGETPALPGRSGASGGHSRLIDSPSVVPAAWDGAIHDDPVYVPSRSDAPRESPRKADLEEVAGKQVWVVYRPSAGLEVSDGETRRTRD